MSESFFPQAWISALQHDIIKTDFRKYTESKKEGENRQMKVLAAGKQAEEPKVPASRKNPAKGKDQETGQVSVWDLLD